MYFYFFLFTGVVYITYAKASMAALAREEMNGQPMPGQTIPLKVSNIMKDSLVKITKGINVIKER